MWHNRFQYHIQFDEQSKDALIHSWRIIIGQAQASGLLTNGKKAENTTIQHIE